MLNDDDRERLKRGVRQAKRESEEIRTLRVHFADGSCWPVRLPLFTHNGEAERSYTKAFLGHVVGEPDAQGFYSKPLPWDEELQGALEHHVAVSLWFAGMVACHGDIAGFRDSLPYFDKPFLDPVDLEPSHPFHRLLEQMEERLDHDRLDRQESKLYQGVMTKVVDEADVPARWKPMLKRYSGVNIERGRPPDFRLLWFNLAYSCVKPYGEGRRQMPDTLVFQVVKRWCLLEATDSEYLKMSYKKSCLGWSIPRVGQIVSQLRKLFQHTSLFEKVAEVSMLRAVFSRKVDGSWFAYEDEKWWKIMDGAPREPGSFNEAGRWCPEGES